NCDGLSRRASFAVEELIDCLVDVEIRVINRILDSELIFNTRENDHTGPPRVFGIYQNHSGVDVTNKIYSDRSTAILVKCEHGRNQVRYCLLGRESPCAV